MQRKKKPETPLQKLKRIQRPRRKTIPELTKEADKWFSREVRLRDSDYNGSEWRGECITCGRKLTVINSEGKWKSNAQNGHYVSRGKKSTRWNDLNCNLQCAHCNAWMDKIDMLARYEKALKYKYGDEVPLELQELGNQEYRPTRQDLEDIVSTAKEFIRFTLAHPKGL